MHNSCSQRRVCAASENQIQWKQTNQHDGIRIRLFIHSMKNVAMQIYPKRTVEAMNIPYSDYHECVSKTQGGCSMFDVSEMAILYRYQTSTNNK